MAILPASLKESNNNNQHPTGHNPTTSNSHHHHPQQSHPPASPSRKPKYYSHHHQQPPFPRRHSISLEEEGEDVSESWSSSSSSSSYDEDFSSSSSSTYNDYNYNYYKNLNSSPLQQLSSSPPRSPQRRSQYYNNNHNHTTAASPRTPNNSSSNSNNNTPKYMHNYKKPVMPARSLYLAMDCEMISTQKHDSIAARVVLVDWKGRTVLDTYMQPPDNDPVVDYKTFVSGVTAEDLKDAPPFAQVQQQVKDLLKDKILVGHGLENDLKALLLLEPYDHPPWWMIRDTAYYQPFMQERVAAGVSLLWTPRKLRDLVQEKLRDWPDAAAFQNGAHCPATDAKAALALYKSHRPRWEACVMQHVKQNTTLTTNTTTANPSCIMSPCSVAMPQQQQQHQRTMMPQMMLPPPPPQMTSSPMSSQYHHQDYRYHNNSSMCMSPMAVSPFYSPSSSSTRYTPSTFASSSPRQKQQQQRSTVTALPSLPF